MEKAEGMECVWVSGYWAKKGVERKRQEGERKQCKRVEEGGRPGARSERSHAYEPSNPVSSSSHLTPKPGSARA